MPEKWPVHIHFNVVLQPCCEPKLLGPRKAAHAENISSYISFFLTVLGNLWILHLFQFVGFSQMNKQNQIEWTGWTKHTEVLFWKFFACLFMSFHSLDMGRCIRSWLHCHFLIHINEYIPRPKRNFQTSKLVLNHSRFVEVEKTYMIIRSNY